ncbi:MAG: Ig domain-containing protein, partial [Acidobacteria bacterium]|nr:Ig domain-containing protein [Acidobacteriota bacterium]
PGVLFSQGGIFSGIPVGAGTFDFRVSAADADGTTASQAFRVSIDGAEVFITTTSLPGGTVGSAYSQTLAASGGYEALTWHGGDGLPPGLKLSADGVVSGITLSPGSYAFPVTAEDAYGDSATRTLSLTFRLPALPVVALAGLAEVVAPLTQPALTLSLEGKYPVPVSGELRLTFVGDDGLDDPAAQFSTGGRTATFTIPANTDLAGFAVPRLALATGTSAGLISLTVRLSAGGEDITPVPAPVRSARIAPLAPVVSSVKATRSGTALTIVVMGYVTSKQVTSLTYTFLPAPGGNFQATTLVSSVEALFSGYFRSAAALPFGSEFQCTQTFNIAGDPASIGSVSVVLTNKLGNSLTVSIPLP